MCANPGRANAVQGFTMIELITVMILLGIIAAVAMPRFASRGDFDVLGFRQQTMQALRFAQKTAIAKRRPVCVSQTAGALTLTFADAYGAAACNTAVLNPATGSAYLQPVPSGVGITALNFTYDPLGRPSFGAAQTLNVTSSGATTQSIVIEAETGYVR
ncbi:type II secretion system protein [Uliginosibacterium sp. H3]|uniref:Type II secretion system protein n=1 Tax=Uliginosibacterium silvisoli TaxID=3114758 RepID=A0ABU6K3N6_9RHOO|nr:type II secretion system protein [Uliginosibacterium sp. H3]